MTLTTALVAIVVLAIGAITVLSRQRSEADRTAKLAAKTEIVKARMAAQDAHLDIQTGQAQELTPEEAQRLAGGLQGLVNQSSDGLVEVQHADGSVSVDLQDRFQSVTVARINKDGSVSQSCVDNPKAAGAFFGIDPQSIDPKVGGPKRAKVSPAGNDIQ